MLPAMGRTSIWLLRILIASGASVGAIHIERRERFFARPEAMACALPRATDWPAAAACHAFPARGCLGFLLSPRGRVRKPSCAGVAAAAASPRPGWPRRPARQRCAGRLAAFRALTVYMPVNMWVGRAPTLSFTTSPWVLDTFHCVSAMTYPPARRNSLEVTFAAAWAIVASVSLPASTVTSARTTAFASP